MDEIGSKVCLHTGPKLRMSFIFIKDCKEKQRNKKIQQRQYVADQVSNIYHLAFTNKV